MVEWYVAAAITGTILFCFVGVPEILQRLGYNPRSAFVRALVWLTFLAIILIPAAATGFLSSVTNPAEWVFFAAVIAVAILYEYYRLNLSHRAASPERENPR